MTVNNLNSWNCVLLLVFRWRHLIVTEDEMLGWHHGLTGREFEQALGDIEGQGSLVCCHGVTKSRTRLNNNSDTNGRCILCYSISLALGHPVFIEPLFQIYDWGGCT